jgi:hypothetical protein
MAAMTIDEAALIPKDWRWHNHVAGHHFRLNVLSSRTAIRKTVIIWRNSLAGAQT